LESPIIEKNKEVPVFCDFAIEVVEFGRVKIKLFISVKFIIKI
jgi:hypothetical protein